ncbi:MAG: sugar phosphate isomerase/epimerase [Chloroflexota bacterium]|nr:sugar phosphate isomerase/epimerase [Chloroflexota bacterium]
MRLCGNSITFEDYPVEEACQRLAASGCNAVEMWKPHLAGCKTPTLMEHFRQFAAELGLELWGLNVVGADYFQPFGSAANYDRTLAGLKEDVDYAIELGVADVMVWEGLRPEDDSPDEDLLAVLTSLFSEAIDYARPKGVGFIAEPHPFTLGMDNGFMKRLCDSLDRECFGILFDFCHYGVGQPTSYVDAIYDLDSRIKHLHYSDSDGLTSELHFPPGKGRLDLAAMNRALAEIGFRGTSTLDMYGYPVPEKSYEWGLPVYREALVAIGFAEGAGS